MQSLAAAGPRLEKSESTNRLGDTARSGGLADCSNVVTKQSAVVWVSQIYSVIQIKKC